MASGLSRKTNLGITMIWSQGWILLRTGDLFRSKPLLSIIQDWTGTRKVFPSKILDYRHRKWCTEYMNREKRWAGDISLLLIREKHLMSSLKDNIAEFLKATTLGSEMWRTSPWQKHHHWKQPYKTQTCDVDFSRLQLNSRIMGWQPQPKLETR